MRRGRGTAVLAGLTLLAAGLSVAEMSHASLEAADPAAPVRATTVEISVMTQNIAYGGDDYDLVNGGYCAVTDGCPLALHRLARIVRASGADILGIQEPEHNTIRLARMLGWHASPAAHVISRFPIIEPPKSNGLYVFVAVAPNRVVAVANVHLISDPSGTFAVRDGATKQEVLKLERETRLHDIQPQLRLLPKLAARGYPVILTGDFNSPSHLDWTKAVSQVRPVVHYPIKWPVGRALADVGFVDSYREIYPDPVAKPGFTWSPGGPDIIPNDVYDRIDWILHSGPASTVDSKLIGEKSGPDVDLGFASPYPSDHRGVVSTLKVKPRKPPVYASTTPRPITAGETIKVSYHAPRVRHDQILLAKQSEQGRLRTVRRIPSPGDFGYHSRVKIDRGLDGKYLIVVRSADRSTIVSKQPIWVYQPGERPTLRSDQASYEYGEPMRMRWTKAPGQGLDWVGIIPCKRHGPCDSGGYLRYDYTESRVQGSLRIDQRHGPMEGSDGWPIPPGRYLARLFIDDSYVAVAQTRRFVVKKK